MVPPKCCGGKSPKNRAPDPWAVVPNAGGEASELGIPNDEDNRWAASSWLANAGNSYPDAAICKYHHNNF